MIVHHSCILYLIPAPTLLPTFERFLLFFNGPAVKKPTLFLPPSPPLVPAINLTTVQCSAVSGGAQLIRFEQGEPGPLRLSRQPAQTHHQLFESCFNPDQDLPSSPVKLSATSFFSASIARIFSTGANPYPCFPHSQEHMRTRPLKLPPVDSSLKLFTTSSDKIVEPSPMLFFFN